MTDLQHKPVFKNAHFECSICGQKWALDDTFGIMALAPCTPKEEAKSELGLEWFEGPMPNAGEMFSVRFDPPLPLDFDISKPLPADEGPIIPVSFRVTHIELYDSDDETRDKGAALLDKWLKDTGDAS